MEENTIFVFSILAVISKNYTLFFENKASAKDLFCLFGIRIICSTHGVKRNILKSNIEDALFMKISGANNKPFKYLLKEISDEYINTALSLLKSVNYACTYSEEILYKWY